MRYLTLPRQANIGSHFMPNLFLGVTEVSVLVEINNNIESRKYGAYVISYIDYKGMVCAIDVSARAER